MRLREIVIWFHINIKVFILNCYCQEHVDRKCYSLAYSIVIFTITYSQCNKNIILSFNFHGKYLRCSLVCYLIIQVYANLIFALFMFQSYKSYMGYRISILYHGDDNIDCNIFMSWIGALPCLYFSGSCAQNSYLHADLKIYSLPICQRYNFK